MRRAAELKGGGGEQGFRAGGRGKAEEEVGEEVVIGCHGQKLLSYSAILQKRRESREPQTWSAAP